MKKIYTLIISTIIFFSAQSQNTWEKRYTFSGAGSESWGICKTLDNKFVISGLEGTSPRSMYLMKIDSLGLVISSWKYAFGADVTTCYVKATADSGFVVYGNISMANGSVVMKIDKTGAIQWTKGLGFNGIEDLLVLSNGDFLISPGSYGYGLIKMSPSGNIIWSRVGVSAGWTTGKIIATPDNFYVISGSRTYSGSDPVYTKVDTSGAFVWSVGADASNPGAGASLCQTSDSGFVFLARVNGSDYGIKVNKNGVWQWLKYIMLGNTPFTTDIVALPNNEFMALVQNNGSSAPWYMELVKFDALQTTATTKRITSGSTPSGFFNSNIIKNNDGTLPGGMIMCVGSKSTINVVRITPSLMGCSTTNMGSVAVTSTTVFTQVPGAGNLGSNTPSIINLTPTFTIASATRTNMCSSTVSPLSASTSQVNPLCFGQCTGTATAIPAGGTSPYTYLWSNSQTTANITGLCAGSYTCTVTDAVSATATVVVTITQPAALALTINTTNNPLSCSGNCNATATAIPSGGTSGYTYLWSPGGQTTATKTALCAGTYTCSVTDANGCTINQTITITQPTAINASATATTTAFCIGGCTNLNINSSGGASPHTYLWMPGSLTSATPNVCPTTTTTYTCTVTDANSCTQSTTIIITVNTIPTTPGTISGTASFCVGGGAQTYSITSVAGASSYTWNIPTGWSGTSSTNSIVATPGTSGGNITVTANNTCGNSSPQTLAVTVNPLPTVNYSQSPSVACENLTSFALSTGTPSGGTYSGTAVTGSTFNPNAAGVGTYIITYDYTDGNGCASSDTSSIEVSVCTSINSVETNSGFDIFPNPTSASINIISQGSKQSTITIYSILGEMFFSTQSNSAITEIDLSAFQNGIYFVQVQTKNSSVTKKIVKQ